MAKKKTGVNKSDLIRDYKAKHPDAKPKEITEALKSHKVSYGLVSAVLHKAKAKKKPGRKTAATKSSTAHSNGHATEFVKTALHLGLDQAISLLEKVKKAVS